MRHRRVPNLPDDFRQEILAFILDVQFMRCLMLLSNLRLDGFCQQASLKMLIQMHSPAGLSQMCKCKTLLLVFEHLHRRLRRRDPDFLQ